MILDKGICTVFRKTDGAQAGAMPAWTYTPIYSSWYGELSYETSPAWVTEGRKERKADGRIRVLQNRDIRQNDVVVLEQLATFAERSEGAQVFQVIRAWHGQDDDGPAPISDLTLEVYEP